ncbi:MAG TPA: trehalose-phosphatase, partial [Gemmatales bacterium]|nr:trehalose-phosphatase [Gemmatales bacterium]
MPTLPLPALASIEPSFHGAEQVLLGLDFDGTLVPIQERPETCHLTVSQRAILERCAALPGVTACIISGRSLADIERRLQLPGWHYAGNHGLEIRLGNKRF